MLPFMVICTFKQGTNMQEVFAVVAEEQSKVAELKAESRLGSVKMAVPNGKVFLEVFASDANHASDTVLELPMAKWWDLEVYPISGTE